MTVNINHFILWSIKMRLYNLIIISSCEAKNIFEKTPDLHFKLYKLILNYCKIN